MSLRYFVLCRNSSYALEIAESLNGFIRNNESEILGVIPTDNDVFIIDAHDHDRMTQINGIDIARHLISYNSDNKFKIYIYSWFSHDYIKSNYRFPTFFRNDNVIFKQLPIQLNEFQQ